MADIIFLSRDICAERVQALASAMIGRRDVGIVGEPRVNVLLLNLALDRQLGRPTAATSG